MRQRSTIVKYIAFLLAICLAGCETDKLLFEGPYFIRFTETTLTKKESSIETVKIEVHNAGPALDKDLSIAYSISGSAREGVDYKMVSERGIVTIKKGEFFGYIEVQLINNANNILRSQDVVFTLLTVSDNSVEVGQGIAGIGNTFTFTIQDDCILSGPYTGTRSAFSVPTKGITISSTDCENYLLSNWNINLFSPPFDYSLTFVDNGDNTLTIPEQDDLKGDGTIDPITGKITMNLTFIGLDDGVDVTTTIFLTPDQP